LIYEFLKTKYEINKSKLSDDEQNEYEKKYLSKIDELLPSEYNFNLVDNQNNESSYINNSVFDTKISREKYIKILKTVFDILELDFDIIEDDRTSIYDGPTALHIPLNNDYDFLTIKRIIELIGHEIESHSVNLRNNEKIL
jgi:hypothetical protein